jgi:hypothetical protein
MKPLSQYINEQLLLKQPSIWKRMYELRTPDTVLLTMTYPKLFSTLAAVSDGIETWEIYKPSIWRSNVEVRKKGNHLPFAKFTAERWGRGGTFELPNGERLKYVFTIWKGRNEILSQYDLRIVSFHRKFSLLPLYHVVIEQHSELLDKNPWVIMAVYYSMLQRRQRSVG